MSGLVEFARTRYLEPVGKALWPYLARVFPGGSAQFKDGFSLQALTRAGEDEDFSILSDGTREQLAVLVRLGFARLFAERGAPVPLVLDDPLVYSDDVRLAAMCGALSEAGGAASGRGADVQAIGLRTTLRPAVHVCPLAGT